MPTCPILNSFDSDVELLIYVNECESLQHRVHLSAFIIYTTRHTTRESDDLDTTFLNASMNILVVKKLKINLTKRDPLTKDLRDRI